MPDTARDKSFITETLPYRRSILAVIDAAEKVRETLRDPNYTDQDGHTTAGMKAIASSNNTFSELLQEFSIRILVQEGLSDGEMELLGDMEIRGL